MAGFTRAEAQSILNYYFRSGAAPTIPAGGWYMALYTVAPTDTTAGTEVTGGSYARVLVPPASWAAPTAADPPAIVNSAIISWVTATASWGTVVALGLFDVATGGTVRYSGPVATPQAVASGVTVSLPIGTASISLD